MATLKHGFLEKESKGYITSTWPMRWCVLTADSLKFYKDQNLVLSKGTFPMNYYTRVTRKAPDGSGKQQILLQNSIAKEEIVLAASDLNTISSWEEAISKVLLSQSKPMLQGERRSAVDNISKSFLTDQQDESFDEPNQSLSLGVVMSLDLQAVIGQPSSILRNGYLLKQGHIVQSWKKRWFVLTPTTLAYFTNDKLSELKGTIKLNQNSYVCLETSNSNERLFPLTLWTNSNGASGGTSSGNSGGNSGTRVGLFMNASDELSSLQWESALCSVILKHKHLEHQLVVRVSLVTEFDHFPIVTNDQIYILQLYINSELVAKEFHHFADLKDVNQTIHQITSTASSSADTSTRVGASTSVIIFHEQFPRSYKRNTFGVSLGNEEIENRRYQLECWLQELIEKYHEFDCLDSVLGSSSDSAVGNEVQNEIALLFGLTSAELLLHVDSFLTAVEQPEVETEKTDMKDSPHQSSMAATAKISSPSSSALSKLFGSSETPQDTPQSPAASAGPHDNTRARTVSEATESSLSQALLSMPDDPNELKTYTFLKLAKLCKLKRIDCRNFKAKKHYFRALVETYRQQLPYLHNKDPFVEIQRISKAIEGSKVKQQQQVLLSTSQPIQLEPQIVTEIDNIFVDLMRRLRVSESLIPLLNVEFRTLEKFTQILHCLSIWDTENDFTIHHQALLFNLNHASSAFSSPLSLSGSSSSSSLTGAMGGGTAAPGTGTPVTKIFLLLVVKYHIARSSASNEWLHRFCVHHGVTILLTVMNQLLEQRPLLPIDAIALLLIIQSFRLIMEKECRDVLMETIGVFDAVVMALIYEYKALVLEVIDFLYECILYGGRNAPWLIMSSFRTYGKRSDRKPYQILIDGIMTGDITVQSGVISLINSLMLYEPELKEKLDLRMLLLSVDLENVCKGYVREYQQLLMGKPKLPAADASDGPGAGTNTSEAADQLLTAIEADPNEQSFIFPTYHRRLRAGIRINDLDMTEGLCEDNITLIHPAEGIMEGYAIEIVEKEEEEKMFTPLAQSSSSQPNTATSRGRSASLMGFPTYNYLNVAPSVFGIGRFARRLSATNVQANPARKALGNASPSTDALRDTVAARRLWYKINLQEKELVWYSSLDECRTEIPSGGVGSEASRSAGAVGRMNLSQIKEVVDYSTLPSRINFPLQHCVTIVTEELLGEPRYYHMSFDCLETKHKWLVALSYGRKYVDLHRSPYRLPPDTPLKSSVTLQLRNNFEKHVTLYHNLCRADSEIIYNTHLREYSLLSGVGGGGTSGEENSLVLDPVDISNFLYYELKTHRNDGKYVMWLKDIVAYVSSNYGPRPVDEDSEFNGSRHPPAVKDSTRSTPRAPPLPPQPPPKPKRKPGTKVKQLFWTKVKPVNVNNTIWQTIEEPELEWDFLDSNFASASTGRRGGIAFQKSSRQSLTSESSKKILISLFDSRRTQNVAIATGKLKKTPEEIYELVVSLDPEELTLEINETILNLLVPTTEEIVILKGYLCSGGSLSDLDYTGRLFGYFLEIEGLESRLSMQRIMLSWFDQAELIDDQLRTIEQAASELRDPLSLHSFQVLLAIILALGNYLNGSTPRGQAHGYRLEILTKLKNMKQTTQAKRTLLHFLVEEISRKYPELPLFYSSWKCLWLATKITRQNLENMMEELSGLLNKCIEAIEAAQFIENERIRCTFIERLSECPISVDESLSLSLSVSHLP
jgi:hypothetical protein